MAEGLDVIYSLPDISFIDDLTLEDLQRQLITSYQEKYEEITGEALHLSRADPNRIILLAAAQYLYQGLVQVDKAAKMNFLKYSYGDYLKHLAAFKNITPLEPKKATVSVLWSLAQARAAATPIPAGSRVTADQAVYFQTTAYAEIPAGETSVAITMECTEAGTAGNGYSPGEISEMADPVPFIDTVANTEESAGGTDEETDEELAERAYLFPAGYSAAGPEAAYIFHAKNYDPTIEDVEATSPSPGVVKICFTMSGGRLPVAAEISGLKTYLEAKDRKPLTDTLQVAAPTAVSYSINATYYINRSDQTSAGVIQAAAEKAISDYKKWQSAKIGRDINPDELLGLLKAAGVKRVVISSPSFTQVMQGHVAVCSAASLTYGGLEDD